MVTLEPFLSTGAQYTRVGRDGWTERTPPGTRTVQYEHTVIVSDEGPIVTTLV